MALEYLCERSSGADGGSRELVSFQLKAPVRQISCSSLFGDCTALCFPATPRSSGFCRRLTVFLSPSRLRRSPVGSLLRSVEVRRKKRAAPAAGGQHRSCCDLRQRQVGGAGRSVENLCWETEANGVFFSSGSPHILGEVLVASESGAANLWTVGGG